MTKEEIQNNALYWQSLGCPGGSKEAEYRRSYQMIRDIYEEYGTYFVLAFLYDCQYGNEDVERMLILYENDYPNLKDYGEVIYYVKLDYHKTMEIIPKIFAEHQKHSTYFVLLYLYGCEYNNDDFKIMVELFKPKIMKDCNI